MTDPLSPEDRALHDSFFEAYRVKYNELAAAAGEGGEISLDACTVYAIRDSVRREISRDLSLSKWQKIDECPASVSEIFAADKLGVIGSVLRVGDRWFLDLDSGEWPKLHISVRCEVFPTLWMAIPEIPELDPDDDEGAAPRIVSAVGVGVRVKPPEEHASLYEQIVDAIKTAPSGRKLEAINEVIKNAMVETPKLSAEAIETMRAARQCYGVCEWWDEITTQVGTLRRFKSSTCGAPEWRDEGANYPVGLTLEQYFAEVGRCQCGRVIVIRGEDELEEGGA